MWLLIVARPFIDPLFDERLAHDPFGIGSWKDFTQRLRKRGLIRGGPLDSFRGTCCLVAATAAARGEYGARRKANRRLGRIEA